MKRNNTLLIVFVIALCVCGWLAFGSQVVKGNSQYTNYIEQADVWVERGLFQRAINSYSLALKENETEELYLKINKAYSMLYKEAPKKTIDDYEDFLKRAVEAYPGNQTLVDDFVDIYSVEEKYEDIYTCLMNAINNGYDSEKVRDNLRKAQYAFKIKASEFSGIRQSIGDYYVASRKENWNVFHMEEGYIFEDEYEYVSLPNEDGMVVVTGNDSRIVDATGMVWGIFKEKVTNAGVFSDDLIAACINDVYSYYDDFADKQFGEYENAGMFQNGIAAVKKDGKWMLIDKTGAVISRSFDEIVLDHAGRYLINDIMLAKENGVYGLYDAENNLLAQIDCSLVDIISEDGIIAVRKSDKWGYANTDGEIVISPSYEEAKSFSYGLAAVKKDGKWGFIDLQNNLVIDCQFSDVGYMSKDGICPVRIDMPEEKVGVDSEEDTKDDGGAEDKVEENELMETTEIWKLLQIVIGIKEN